MYSLVFREYLSVSKVYHYKMYWKMGEEIVKTLKIERIIVEKNKVLINITKEKTNNKINSILKKIAILASASITIVWNIL